MRTMAWGVVKSLVDGKTFYAPTEFEIEDGHVVKATSFNAGVYEALAYAALPDIIQGFYRAHLTRKAVGERAAADPVPAQPKRPAGRAK